MEKKFNKTKVDELETGSVEDLTPGKKTKPVKEDLTDAEKEKQAALEEIDDFTGVNDIIENK
jgi:hypothetical protein